MERKKIVPKAKLDASKQEELLRKLQQDTENAVTLQQNTASVSHAQKGIEEIPVKLQQDTENTVTLQQNTAPVTHAQKDTERNSVKLQQNTAKTVNLSTPTIESTLGDKNNKIQRITVDMPIDLYDKMKNEVDDNGQTIKGFVVNLVRAHFKKMQ